MQPMARSLGFPARLGRQDHPALFRRRSCAGAHHRHGGCQSKTSIRASRQLSTGPNFRLEIQPPRRYPLFWGLGKGAKICFWKGSTVSLGPDSRILRGQKKNWGWGSPMFKLGPKMLRNWFLLPTNHPRKLKDICSAHVWLGCRDRAGTWTCAGG